jgi:hypothetical protein
LFFGCPSGGGIRNPPTVPKINRVEIENYKSIERVDFEARRVNVFIGGPNAGKTNILESIALLGNGTQASFQEIFRSHQISELFRDQEIDRDVKLALNGCLAWSLSFVRSVGKFRTAFGKPNASDFVVDVHSGSITSHQFFERVPDWAVRFYTYRPNCFARGQLTDFGALTPPFGANLPEILFSNRHFRESVATLFKAYGYRLELRPQSSEILISKQVDDILYSYPFDAISETLRRIVFYKAVLETNRDAVLVLDEPEANTFPFYTKYLAERIALDESNQFFLTTHNPYVLMSIIEKTPATDLAVFVTRMKDYRTQIQPLTGEQLGEALDLGMDLFLNLDRYFAD